MFPHHPVNSQLASTHGTAQWMGSCVRTQGEAQPGPDQTQQRPAASDQLTWELFIS